MYHLGGCLTETINRHKQMRRRLSHWTALCYLKQILEVLKYFQKKRVIHEDLKGEILLVPFIVFDVNFII